MGEIMAHFAMYNLSEEGELKLVERGNHRELMSYIAKHGLKLSNAFKDAIKKRGNQREIEALETYSA